MPAPARSKLAYCGEEVLSNGAAEWADLLATALFARSCFLFQCCKGGELSDSSGGSSGGNATLGVHDITAAPCSIAGAMPSRLNIVGVRKLCGSLKPSARSTLPYKRMRGVPPPPAATAVVHSAQLHSVLKQLMA